MYNPSDPELIKERHTVRLLFQEFNSLNENQAEKRNTILYKIFKKR
ncbi:maltose acetyltransferase domain-containing protein [Corallibacter sp.]